MAESRLRPESWDDLVGNRHNKMLVRRMIEAARSRQPKEQPEHIMLEGAPGLGKSAFAVLILGECRDRKRVNSASNGVIGEIMTLRGGEFVFADEIHAMKATVFDYLKIAMEGGSAGFGRKVPPWTLVGATTDKAQVPLPVRDRFGLVLHLDFYPEDEIGVLAVRSAHRLNMELRPQAAQELACRSRGVPRIANRLLRRVRDVYSDPTEQQVDEIMVELGVDSWGLESVDRNLIVTIYDRFDGGPVGVRTLSAALGVAEETLTDALEPYLLRRRLIDVTERGRQLTTEGWMYCRLLVGRTGGES